MLQRMVFSRFFSGRAELQDNPGSLFFFFVHSATFKGKLVFAVLPFLLPPIFPTQ